MRNPDAADTALKRILMHLRHMYCGWHRIHTNVTMVTAPVPAEYMAIECALQELDVSNVDAARSVLHRSRLLLRMYKPQNIAEVKHAISLETRIVLLLKQMQT